MLFKGKVGSRAGEGRLASRHACETLGFLNETFLAPRLRLGIETLEELLAVMLVELWLVIEQVLLGGSSVHEEKDDPLGLGGKV